MNRFVEPLVSHHLHPSSKPVHVIDTLGLNKINTRPDLLCQADYSKFKRITEWIGRRPDEHLDFPFDLLPSTENGPLIPHGPDTIDQLD